MRSPQSAIIPLRSAHLTGDETLEERPTDRGRCRHSIALSSPRCLGSASTPSGASTRKQRNNDDQTVARSAQVLSHRFVRELMCRRTIESDINDAAPGQGIRPSLIACPHAAELPTLCIARGGQHFGVFGFAVITSPGNMRLGEVRCITPIVTAAPLVQPPRSVAGPTALVRLENHARTQRGCRRKSCVLRGRVLGRLFERPGVRCRSAIEIG